MRQAVTLSVLALLLGAVSACSDDDDNGGKKDASAGADLGRVDSGLDRETGSSQGDADVSNDGATGDGSGGATGDGGLDASAGDLGEPVTCDDIVRCTGTCAAGCSGDNVVQCISNCGTTCAATGCNAQAGQAFAALASCIEENCVSQCASIASIACQSCAAEQCGAAVQACNNHEC